ncbi:MAG: proton-conducting transporter membrane subunit [Gemmatimonadaceae bacterium]
MNYETAQIVAPGLVWLCTLALLIAPEISAQKERQWVQALLLASLMGVAVVAASGPVAYGLLAVVSLMHAAAAARTSRTSALSMGVAALACGVAAGALWFEQVHIAFGASIVATALRCGLFPLHGGIAALCDRLPRVQAQQLASLPILVFAHLRFVDHSQLAFDLAIPIVIIGATSMLAFGLISLVQRDLAGLFRASTLMHGGMLFAAVGAAGRGHYAAALIVAITMGIALTGFSIMLSALEARSGSLVTLMGGGRARAFPRMAACLAFFGGAAVGLPGTSGFIADDLLLHALWGESVTSAVMMILASALLAVAILAGFARAFLGKPVRQLAPDLQSTERVAAVMLVALLIALGVAPSLLVDPVSALMK